MPRQKMLFFINAQLPNKLERDLIEGFSDKYDVKVRTRKFSDNYGERDEPADIVYNAPPGEYAGVSVAQNASTGVLVVGVGYKEINVGETTRAHACYCVSDAITVANEHQAAPQLDDTQDFTGSTITVETSNAVLVSSDPSVLTVAADGLVTGVSSGTATITATFNGKVATCGVTVK